VSFFAAVPVIGQALDSVFKGLDSLFTSDDERMKAQNAMLMAFQPVILAVLQAQGEFDKLRNQVDLAMLQSGDRLIRWTRPLMTWLTFITWGYMALTNHAQADYAFYAFGLIGGLWSASRGGEKIVSKWVNGGKSG